jgi:hypothetical protein
MDKSKCGQLGVSGLAALTRRSSVAKAIWLQENYEPFTAGYDLEM